jgi:uncharacterized protein (TIGR02246 family)
MKKLLMVSLVFLLCFAFGCQEQGEEMTEEPAVDIVTEKANVQAVLDNYARAWETLDFELFSDVFSHDPGLVVFSAVPSESYMGWEAFQKGVQKTFKESEGVEIAFQDVAITVHSSGNLAWVTCREDWKLMHQDQPVSDEGARMTWILEKQDGQWKVIHAHWSLPQENNTTNQ